MDLDHLNLRVRDAAACRDFYERHFGFRPAFEAEGGYFVRNGDGFLLALVPADPHQPLPEGFHVGFALGGPDEVSATHERLAAAGVPVSDLEDHRPDEDYATFRCWDPDGTEIEVFWEAPPAVAPRTASALEPVRPGEVHERWRLPDWRVLLGRIEATYEAAAFDEAVAFVRRVGAAAAAAGHHPDVDLRPPGLVRVALTTHDAGGLTTADVELAAEVSAIAADAGVVAAPLASASLEIGIDAMDIDAVLPFWKAVLAYVDAPAFEGGQVVAIVDPRRIGPPVWFQQMDAPRPQRNRVHLDVTVPHDAADERVAAALAAGGRLLSGEHARAFWVLADPEGNEACVCTWQDRDEHREG